MARYTGLFKIATSTGNPHALLSEILESCNFNIIYQSGDYLMARETPGKVAFHKLVTVEVLVDKKTTVDSSVHMNVVIKNEELPLQVDNHCYQIFNQVSQAISETNRWQLLDAVGS